MKFQNHIILDRSWHYLVENPHLHDFRNEQEFRDACEDLEDVSGDGRQSYLCRITTTELFSEENLAIVNVTLESNGWNRVTWPAIQGGLDNEQEGQNHDQ